MGRYKGMNKRKLNNYFGLSYKDNNYNYINYFNRLVEIGISVYEWINVPSSVDTRFLELVLLSEGQILWFKDDVVENYVVMQFASGGDLDIYRVPTIRDAYAVNGYTNTLYNYDSVIIYNNLLRETSMLAIDKFASDLVLLDSIIRINANSQKTPIMIRCSENQRLTIENLFMQYDGNAPVIFGDKSLDLNAMSVLKLDAPFNADKIYELKTNIWNEALTYFGVPNVSIQKKERLITDEVNRTMGGVIASGYSRLTARKNACKQINEMFGLDVDCKIREGIDVKEIGRNLETIDEVRVDV